MKTNLLTYIVAILIAAAIAAFALNAQAASESPSELLEKGIYTEETKGDVDSAIAIYQQLVAETNLNQSLAAQAQFHLGQCYLKKNRTAEATSAFEKVIRDYPNEKELVAKAREHLPKNLELGPVPWVDGERLQLNMTLATGADIGTAEYRADLVSDSNGQKIWRVGCRLMAGAQSVSSVDVHPETFRPLSSRWKHGLLGEALATYDVDKVQIRRVGRTDIQNTTTDGVAYDNEEAMFVIRRLPLQVGYKTTLPVFTTLGGGASIQLALEVTKKETIEVPAGKFECFKVHLGLVNQDFWFSDDAHHYLVKFDAGSVIAQLTSITQRRPGETVAFLDKETGVSFTAPSDWVVWRAENGQPAGQVLIRTLDPDADTDDGGLRLFPTGSLSDAERLSARAWAEDDLKKNRFLKVRPDTWKNIVIDGRQAISREVEYTEGGKTRVQFSARVIGPKYSELFVLTCGPDKYTALKTQFDTVLATYRTK